MEVRRQVGRWLFRLWLGDELSELVTRSSTGGGSAIREADAILVLDSDVPWIPSKLRPSSNFFKVFADSRTLLQTDVDVSC